MRQTPTVRRRRCADLGAGAAAPIPRPRAAALIPRPRAAALILVPAPRLGVVPDSARQRNRTRRSDSFTEERAKNPCTRRPMTIVVAGRGHARSRTCQLSMSNASCEVQDRFTSRRGRCRKFCDTALVILLGCHLPNQGMSARDASALQLGAVFSATDRSRRALSR